MIYLKRSISILFTIFFLTLFSASLLSAVTDDPKKLLSDYGWTVYGEFDTATKIPKQFTNSAGEYPNGLFWAYNNVLSKQIGLDLSKYRGKNVKVRMFTLNEILPESCRPFTAAMAMIVIYNEKIAGAWISGINCGCSLDRNAVNLRQINGEQWQDWLISAKIVNKNDKLDKYLSSMNEEELILYFFESLSKGNYKDMYACFSRRYLLNTVFYDFAKSKTFKDSLTKTFLGENDVIERVTVIGIDVIPTLIEGNKAYKLTLKEERKGVPAMEREWVFLMREEIPGMGPRIADVRR
ncbi:MAG: DUF4830 domain-containing protein [Elusimicrobiota bacterium]